MKDAAEALAALLERVSRFFDLFDLSFVISGATALAALAVSLRLLGMELPALDGWLLVAIVVVGSYVSGIVCFAVGRWSRMLRQSETGNAAFDAHFKQVLDAHGLTTHPEVSAYIGREPRGIWRLYVRLWAEIRRTPGLNESLALLNRYWLMAAMFDGMACALFAWIAALVVWGVASGVSAHLVYAIFGGAVLSALILACAREAGRYVEYQVEELVAVFANLVAPMSRASPVVDYRPGQGAA
jgi:hypothetical protein